jgi:hypothetical protein
MVNACNRCDIASRNQWAGAAREQANADAGKYAFNRSALVRKFRGFIRLRGNRAPFARRIGEHKGLAKIVRCKMKMSPASEHKDGR